MTQKKPESKKLKDMLAALESKEFQLAGGMSYHEDIDLSEPWTHKETLVAQRAYKQGHEEAWAKADIIIQYLIKNANK